MKKYFTSYIINDPIMFMAAGFVLFIPLWVLVMIKVGFSLMITFWVVMSLIHLVNSYVKFNSEDYKRKKEINKEIEQLTLKEKEKMLAQLKSSKTKQRK